MDTPGDRTHIEGKMHDEDAKQMAEEKLDSSHAMRKRIRAERVKITQEQIKKMKERQRKSEVWKTRQPYVHSICAGVAVIAAGYLFYHFYLNVS